MLHINRMDGREEEKEKRCSEVIARPARMQARFITDDLSFPPMSIRYAIDSKETCVLSLFLMRGDPLL